MGELGVKDIKALLKEKSFSAACYVAFQLTVTSLYIGFILWVIDGEELGLAGALGIVGLISFLVFYHLIAFSFFITEILQDEPD